MKKIISVILAISLLIISPIISSAVSMTNGKDALVKQFQFAEGPKAGEYSIDYRYYSPVKENDETKYPLVIWLHGMWDGSSDNKQVEGSNISYWSSEEFQSRFTSGGAFILAARSREEDNICWDNSMIEPLKAAIDEFIKNNKNYIDLSRIYIGGYSMGGKMTLKMTVAFPEMFAAAFPICPAWSPSEDTLEIIADTPIWLTTGKPDPIVNYFLNVNKTWDKICATTNVPEECRFSTLSKVCFEDGKKTTSAHHSWFSVNHDMFSSDGGAYPYMQTVNGIGETVTLTYPNGMISWLCSHTSGYDGTATEGIGNLENVKETDNLLGVSDFFEIIKGLFDTLKAILTSIF